MCKVKAHNSTIEGELKMKFFTTLNSTNRNTQCQLGIEVDIADNTEMKEIEQKIKKALESLNIAVNSAVNIKPLLNTSSQLPAPTATSSKISAPATPGQIKFMTDLTAKCGTTLEKWCNEHGIKPDEITKKDAMKWIPELEFKAEG